MKFTFAKKSSMTQFFSPTGEVFAATLLTCEPLCVTQTKSVSGKDGYDAIQVGAYSQKESRVSKAKLGHLKGNPYKVVREFRTSAGDLSVGALIAADIFQAGDMVSVSSVSKGKGFQGVMKLHGFSGGWGQHGQKHSAREAGSIGSTGQQRVNRGKKMPGRMGSDKVTEKNREILGVDLEKGLILVKGAVAGKRGTLVELKG
jgi:large subunit ribosomal protein L3